MRADTKPSRWTFPLGQGQAHFPMPFRDVPVLGALDDPGRNGLPARLGGCPVADS
jgi:hypothetical protein